MPRLRSLVFACVVWLILVIASLMGPIQSSARTWHVDKDGFGDAPTIQAGVDSAEGGDTVLVGAGTYFENVDTREKSLTLKSLAGAQSTIIDGQQHGPVLLITGDAEVRGFTIRNGLNEDGGGLRLNGKLDQFIRCTVVDNIITGNRAGYNVDEGQGGGLLLLYTTDVLIQNNVFTGNYAGDSGGGIYGAIPRLTQVLNNTFIENGCHVCGGAISGGVSYVQGNLFLRNWSDSFGGALCGYFGPITNNTIVMNYINNGTFTQGAGIHTLGSTPMIERNIVALNHGPAGTTGVGIRCATSDGTIIIRCNDVWGNDVDYELVAGCDSTGNFSLDPLFCDQGADNFDLSSMSPCTEAHSPTCGPAGAFTVGCGVVGVRQITWGRIKTLYGLGN